MMNLFEFADLVGQEIRISYYNNQSGRFCVRFDSGEISEPGVLIGAHGNGNGTNPLKALVNAINEYTKKISNQKIVFHAYTDKRIEYNVPELISIEATP